MQKKIIALAVAALASAGAYAQSNVTVYGIADMYIGYGNHNAGTNANTAEQHGRDTLSVNSGGLAGSRLGFKGTEDLGNGLKAVFALEYGLSLDTNSGVGTSLARQQYVGLSSAKLGTFTLGRQYAPAYGSSVATDALVYSAFSNKQVVQNYLGGTIVAGSNARWNNSINYMTPTFGGVSVQAIYRAGEQANEIAMGEGYGVGVNYAGGPVTVKYVYQHAENGPAAPMPTGATPGTTGVTDEHYLGLAFDAKVVKLFASAQTLDGGNREYAGQAREGFAYDLGVQIPVGRGTIATGYAYADKNSNTRSGSTYNGKKESVSVAYLYSLSKRTTLYTGVIYTDDNAKNSTSAGVDTTVAAGINHSF